ncbi:MAG: glycerol-3-phosphate 1-O-acyltransferase PlsY [Burkholderiales bacterium]|nr:glycerol-3-phosphate 1-O-acyltransferase PlsY [Burkholderiales bacterium]
MTVGALALLAYLIGSVPFAVVVSRLFALPDPRSYGSGNPGATNVLRTGRKSAAALTLAGDAAKGWLAVALAQRYGGEDAVMAAAIAAVAVCAGHMYSVLLRLRGGKGVSTAVGVMLAVNGYVAAGAVATWFIIAAFFRISSLAALVAAAFVPCFSLLLYGMNEIALEPALALAAVAALVVWRHRANIRNLVAGTEGRIGERDPGARGG